ncbi:MAG: HpcH/HpaI aldolase/citrate lyase family protein [Pseudomonadota bacterium]
MSFARLKEAPARPNRSELAVPGSRPELFEKAARSAADIVFLDLEDAVAIEDKERARRHVVEALNDVDWRGRPISVRINGLDTAHMYRDVVAVVEGAGRALDLIMIPKVGTAADVYALDMLVSQIEAAMGLTKRIGFELIIESALGMANVEAIAAASPRIESLHFGAADFAASTRARTTAIGGANPDYSVLSDPDPNGARTRHWGDMWHYPLARLVVAARAHGLRPIDGPFGDFRDAEGFLAAGRRAAALGCDGKWAIHPSQIEAANALFTPSEPELAKARAILEAMERARAEGRGAAALDGRLIDIASIRQAEALLATAERIAAARRS